MNKIAVLIALAGIAPTANAQSVVYGARAVGDAAWSFGSFGLTSFDSNPLTFEIGVFFDRRDAAGNPLGVGLSTCAYKTFITGVDQALDEAAIVEDVYNGVPTSGVDGRVGLFNSRAQTQRVFTSGNTAADQFRISASSDTANTSAAGGISVKQFGPIADPFDGGVVVLGYRFDVRLHCDGLGLPARLVDVNTPLNRLSSFTTFNSLGSNGSTEWKAQTTVAGIQLSARWIPAPSTLALLGLAGLARRPRC